jgi:glycosyltransferase involved in cell wall biosynthesis
MTQTPHKPYHILQLIPTLQSGGAEQSCIDVTAAITAAGHVAYVGTQGGRWTAEIIRAGGKIIPLPLKSKNPLTIWRNVNRIADVIAEYNIDIVHARSRAPAWSGYLAAKKMGVPFMTTFHAAYKFSSKLKQRYNAVMAKGVRIIAISQYIAQHILDNYNVDPGRIRIIYRGTPLDRFHPSMVHTERLIKLAKEWQLPEDKKIILMPSRLTRIKGHHVLIEALTKLNREDYFCIICGATPDREHYQQELMKLIEEYGLTEKVRIVPICTDVPAAMRLSQVMVAPSLVPEGFGRMPVEAQAMGTPVVASAIGGHKEIIIDRETGWLVPPDDAQAMADAMNEALNMTEAQRITMAEKAMKFVTTHFGKEQMTHHTLEVYDEIMAESGR